VLLLVLVLPFEWPNHETRERERGGCNVLRVLATSANAMTAFFGRVGVQNERGSAPNAARGLNRRARRPVRGLKAFALLAVFC
jgi:hypothetical protein